MTFLYERFLKPILFLQRPETVHDRALRIGRIIGEIPPGRWLLAAVYRRRHPKLRQYLAGIVFESPIGLAAGFDKDAHLMKVLPSLGFGFAEVGSVTARPYGGNPSPRAVRLPKDNALIINYGLKNEGARAIRPRLQGRRFAIPIGVSIAKTNLRFKSDKEKLDDWMEGIRLLKGSGDYLTINLSCPNTYDTENYCDPRLLAKLLRRIKRDRVRFTKPVFLKLTADLTEKQADEIIRLCTPIPWVTGFILTNLVKDRRKLSLASPREAYEPYKGGLSGKIVQPHALKLVRRFRRRAGDRFILVGCGGIFTPEDAYQYILAGANLVQLVTGMIFRGPGTIKEVNKGLVRLLEKDGYRNISEAVGKLA